MKRYIFALALFVVSNYSITHAQSDSTKSTYNESVIVVGDYNPVLDGITEKVNVAPTVSENNAESSLPEFKYSITPRRMSSISATSGIKAAKVIGSPTRLYNNYLRFGLGHDFSSFVDFTPMMDLFYTSTRHENYSYGARLYHQTDITTFGKYDEAVPSPDFYSRNRESVTRFDIFGKYILDKKHLFSANLAFDREYGRYYGFSDSMLFQHLAMKRDEVNYSDYAFAYNNLSLNLGAKSLNTDINKLGYDVNMAMADYWTRYHSNQLSMDLSASIHYGFPMFRQYKAVAYLCTRWRGYRQKYNAPASISDLPLGYLPSANLPDSVNDGRSLFTIGPNVDFLFNGLKFHVGFDLGVNGYDSTDTPLNLFPDLSVAKSFSNNSMSLTVGFHGDYKANDWNKIRLINPFVNPTPLSMATIDNNLYAHFRINFSKKLILNLRADNHFYDNDLFFELDKNYALNNVFKTYYLDYNDFVLGTDFTFVNDEMITMTLGLDYHLSYNLPDNVPLLYDNTFDAYFDVSVDYKEKWFFTLNTMFVSGTDAEYIINKLGKYEITHTLPARLGLGLEVEYVHSRALSFFAKFDNLTFQRYMLWANYPEPRFNAMLGLTYTIP